MPAGCSCVTRLLSLCGSRGVSLGDAGEPVRPLSAPHSLSSGCPPAFPSTNGSSGSLCDECLRSLSSRNALFPYEIL